MKVEIPDNMVGRQDMPALCEGLAICLRYCNPNQHDLSMAAEHDRIYVGPPPDEMGEEDKLRMEELKFHHHEQQECWVFYL